MKERVIKIIAEKLGISSDQIKEESSFANDLGADSLDMVELAMSFEEEFGIEISDEDAEKNKTVGDAIRYLESRKV